MRKLIWFFLLVVALPSLAQGMFDLPSGAWASSDEGPRFRLETGTVKDHKMAWHFDNTDVKGTYQVTSNKGQPSFQMKVDSLSAAGKSVDEADLAGLHVKKGDSIRCMISWETGGGIQFTTFDAEIQPMWTRKLKKVK